MGDGGVEQGEDVVGCLGVEGMWYHCSVVPSTSRLPRSITSLGSLPLLAVLEVGIDSEMVVHLSQAEHCGCGLLSDKGGGIMLAQPAGLPLPVVPGPFHVATGNLTVSWPTSIVRGGIVETRSGSRPLGAPNMLPTSIIHYRCILGSHFYSF